MFALTLRPLSLALVSTLVLSSCAPHPTTQAQPATTKPTSSTPMSNPSPTSPHELPVTVLASGTQAAYMNASSAQEPLSVQLASTPSTLNALWHAAYARQSPLPAMPTLTGQTAVGVFMGTRPTGGYGVKVVGAKGNGDTLLLTVQTLTPKPGMMTTQALTSPWVIVSVPGHYSRVQLQTAPASKQE